ncbi:hypothetical protein, partial [Elstera sp.]|uniref:hypothetical protein n=1 Tax=Elstera sp. TaxID=1916664 RepID=UPI0037C0247B
SATYRQPRPKNDTTPCWTHQPWPHNLNQTVSGKLGAVQFDLHRGRFTEHTRLTADIKLPELTRDSFIDLYPLLPYQIDLIIQVVSGLRTQGGFNSKSPARTPEPARITRAGFNRLQTLASS